MKTNVSKETIINENDKAQTDGTQSVGSDNVVYNGIVFPRRLINASRATFQPYSKEELSDEYCAMALYKYAKLEMLLREIKERIEARKITAANKEPKEELKND